MPQNTLLTYLNIQEVDKIVSITEHDLADANFIVTHLAKQILDNNGKICFVMLHNTLGHYHNVLKRLGCDLMKKIQDGDVEVVEFLKQIGEDVINDEMKYFGSGPESILQNLSSAINSKIGKLSVAPSDKVTLIVDDLSHLFDLNVDLKHLVTFSNHCINLTSAENVYLVVNVHVGSASDRILANNIGYVADVVVEVSNLKTGMSRDVTGVIKLIRVKDSYPPLREEYHYKALEKEIKTFHPGESLNFLYK